MLVVRAVARFERLVVECEKRCARPHRRGSPRIATAPGVGIAFALAPPGAATTCAVDGWEPTDLAEAVESTEMVALSSAFVPADFDPADYQFRIGRGDDYAYCWPLEDLGTPSELGRCR